jgi:serine/threonine-protein kinase HipA
MKCTIERFIDGQWIPAGTLTTTDPTSGCGGPCVFEYCLDYAARFLDRPDARIGCGYPVNFEHRHEATWPGFMVDLLPQGDGRRRVMGELGRDHRQDGAANDWDVLLHGAGNPPGYLRIAEAAARFDNHPHPGFTREEVVERNETFIEYATAHGAPVAGSSGAQGEAPKFLLTLDHAGRWHADGALPDHQAKRHYLVKFPRGKAASDRQILRNEAPYYEVARHFGLTVAAPLEWAGNTLFIQRFDREVNDAGVGRLGLESLYALAGVATFGQALPHDRLAGALARFSTAPMADLIEYVLRDVLNVAMRNTDNHGRNTAVLKRGAEVRLSPLYDFAPMFLDDSGIARVCRWEGDAEIAGIPVWGKVAEKFAYGGLDPLEMRRVLAGHADKVRALPETMASCGVEEDIIERLILRTTEVAKALADALPTMAPKANRDHRP